MIQAEARARREGVGGDALGSSETLTRAVKLRSGAAMRPGGLDEGGRLAMELRRVGGGVAATMEEKLAKIDEVQRRSEERRRQR